jgi:hypothetical protein
MADLPLLYLFGFMAVALAILVMPGRQPWNGRRIHWAVLLALILAALCQLHELRLGHWTIGPYLLPVAVLGPDGRHPDGSPDLYGGTHGPLVFWGCYLAVCMAIRRWCTRGQAARRRGPWS